MAICPKESNVVSTEQDLATIARQEATLRFRSFDELVAWEIGCQLREVCLERQHPVVIDVRRFGHPLFFTALPGTTPDNLEWVRRKSNTVARFHRSSYGLGLELLAKGTTLEDKFGLTLETYAAHGGAFPLAVANAGIIGSVAVSGLPQRDDHELVVEVLSRVLGFDYSDLRL
jgi:uncharacterized protein (UPF0303 family)